MADNKQPHQTILKRRSPDVNGGFQHLKPLSVYSRMIAAKSANSDSGNLSWTPSRPFYNSNIELIKGSTSIRKKRRLYDSGLDETYETPLKKVFRPNCHSPDLACVLDSPNDSIEGIETPLMSTPLTEFRKLVKQSARLQESPFCPVLDLEPLLTSAATSISGCNAETLPQTLLSDNNGSRKVQNLEISVPESVHGVQETNEVSECEDVLSVSQQLVNPEFQMTILDETYAESSFESTSPLRVQVKSKVVVPDSHKQEVSTKPKADPKPSLVPQEPFKKLKSGGQQEVKRAQRPVVFPTETTWQREMRKYVDSVTMHMSGVMGELYHLMNHVADQKKERGGRYWQHPSDLTCRNFWQKNSHGRLMSLDEWQNLNNRNYRRFEHVPKVFLRSPVQ